MLREINVKQRRSQPSLENIDHQQYNSQNYIQLSDIILPLMFHCMSICVRASVLVNIELGARVQGFSRTRFIQSN